MAKKRKAKAKAAKKTEAEEEVVFTAIGLRLHLKSEIVSHEPAYAEGGSMISRGGPAQVADGGVGGTEGRAS